MLSADLVLHDSVDSAHARLVVEGELDIGSTPLLVDRFDDVLAQEPDHIVLGLRDVTFADSTGIAALIRCRRRAMRCGTSLALDVGNGPVAQLLELTKLQRVFDLV